MKKYIFFLLFPFFFLISPSCFAQKTKPKESERKMIFNIKDYQYNKAFLVIHYKDKFLLKDSAVNNGNGVFVFESNEKLDDGMYSLISNKRVRLLDFILDRNQKFIFNLDTTGNVLNFSVLNSPENAEMLRFQQKTVEAKKKIMDWDKKRTEFDSRGKKDSAEYFFELIKEVNREMELFITDLINRNPTYLFSKFQKSYREIEIPEPPVYPNGSIDSLFQIVYYRTHYWDNFDLTDRRFLFLPSYEPKLNNYFKKVLLYLEADTINKYADLMLGKTISDSLMYRFLVEYLLREFELSKVPGHDAVFVHLAKGNVLAGKCNWIDEDLLKKYKMRIEELDPLLIGKKSVEMILPDTTQTDVFSKWISSYKMPKKYRILWFYEHNCPTCQKESKVLKVVYDSLENIGKLNFDVYAVNRTDDIARWKKYIIENGYTWINVGGGKGNVDWTKEYHISQYPQFYIINQDKIIILNRDIDKNMIPLFIEEYEKQEVEKARLKNKRQ